MNKVLCFNSILLGMCCTPLKAQESSADMPSIAFLEYLAEMTEIDGKLYGPQDLPLIDCKKILLKRDEKKDGSGKGDNEKIPKDESSILEQECLSND